MKKSINIFVTMLIVLLIAGCSNNNNEFELYGDYTYGSCVYLNPFSSSTIESKTETNSGLIQVILNTDFFSLNQDTEELKYVADPIYVDTDINDNIDEAINLEIFDFLDDITNRFDIYSDDTYTEYSIFYDSSTIYLAELRILGTNEYYTVWEVFEIVN
ncbi:hypothetical protein RJI07_04775 [Mycoplasmatota bacterium WC30]